MPVDLYMEFASSDGSLQLATEHPSPLSMVLSFYLVAQVPEEVEKFKQVEATFLKLSGDNWDEDWDSRCEYADLPSVKEYLVGALQFLKAISDASGNLTEPYAARFKLVEQRSLWDYGFFFWEDEDHVRSREFVPAVTKFLSFLDEVMNSKSDVLCRLCD